LGANCWLPRDVFFAGANPVQPDLVGWLSNGQAQGVPRGVEGPPDLLVEVLSPSNRNHDLLTKRALYGQAGVREYWVVDPEARTLIIHALDRDALHLVVTTHGSDLPVSPLFGPLPFTVAEIFAGIEQ
jgi:Uma2 family endonuclease